MNILYLGYWNLGDPLTVATIYPSLRVLRELQPTVTIVFVNIQRETLSPVMPDIFKELAILYNPILSGNNIIYKINDFVGGPVILEGLCSKHRITKVIARGAPAGALAYLLWKRNRTPFFVESFEPHSDYMLESEVWTKFDLRYLLQHYWENKQKKYAAGLMPVATNYKNQLIEELVNPEKIKVVPCVINVKDFSFNEADRIEIRRKLDIKPDALVGLYAGKYGGLYLAEESFKLYRIFFDQFSDFRLIILTPKIHHSWISAQIIKYSLPSSRIFVNSVDHTEVSSYCSASDFAFATYKPGPSKAYLSPIKVGEYWVNGLPVLLTMGIGDKSGLVEKCGGGVLFEPDSINHPLFIKKINDLVVLAKRPETRPGIADIGLKLRSFEKLKLAYEYFLLE